MATINKINSSLPIEISFGGTENSSLISYAVICGGTTPTSPLQQVASVGSSGEVLTSEGAATLPIFRDLPTFFQPLASDPASPSIGDVWFNTTTNLFKGAIDSGGAGAWVIKANLNRGIRGNLMFGTENDCISACGSTGTPRRFTERYNLIADSWTSKSLTITARFEGGAGGLPDSGGIFGGTLTSGSPTGLAERYDGIGDAWSATANMPVPRTSLAGAGSTANDWLAFGGRSGGTAFDNVQRYDGIGNSWATKANLLQPRQFPAGGGSAGDAMAFTGRSSGGIDLSTTERYDGVGDSWSLKANINTPRNQGGGGGQSGGSVLSFGGSPTGPVSISSRTEEYDGIANTWTIRTGMNNARSSNGGTGSSGTGGITAGGITTLTGFSDSTEVYGGSPPTIVTFTVV